MTTPLCLNGIRMRVVSTDSNGEVNCETQFLFSHEGSLVSAQYSGGNIRLGYLAGTMSGEQLRFRFVQVDLDGRIDSGSSFCDFEVLADGRLQMREHFSWDTRDGSGINFFEEIAPTSQKVRSMYVSKETPEQTQKRLLKVISQAEFKALEGNYTFEEFALLELSARMRNDALALVRDETQWSQLVPARDASRERCKLFRFHFAQDLDNSGFVGWLATHLKNKLGTGVFVVCGQNSRRGGIFDYLGCPVELGSDVQLAIESLIAQGKAG